MNVNGLHKLNYIQITTQKVSKSMVEPVAIFQQIATKASWNSNFYIYYKQIRNKILSINLSNNNQNTQTILRIRAPKKHRILLKQTRQTHNLQHHSAKSKTKKKKRKKKRDMAY